MPDLTPPLVSVIIPAYNAERFIKQTLESVLLQTYTHFEVLVVDDGSQDQTASIVAEVSRMDHRVKLYSQKNVGVASARNLAIKKSQGDYIAPLDADDVWELRKLELQIQCMLQSPFNVGLVYAWSTIIDEKGESTGGVKNSELEGNVFGALLAGNFVGHASAPLIRRICFENLGGYNCKLREKNAQGCEDLDLYIRIAELYEFRVVREFLIRYRQYPGSMSDNHAVMLKSYFQVHAEVKQRNPEIPAFIFRKAASFYYITIGAGSFRKHSRYWFSFSYLLKAAFLNPRVLLYFNFYRFLCADFLRFVLQLVKANRIWPYTSVYYSINKHEKVQNRLKKIINKETRLEIKQWQKLKENDFFISKQHNWQNFIKNRYCTMSDIFAKSKKSSR